MSELVKARMEGAQRLQAAHLKIIEALKPTGPRGAMVKGAAIAAHAYAVRITHRDTGNLALAHRVTQTPDVAGPWSRAYVEMGSRRHPRSGVPANVYGPIEHARGGSHAFYARTEREAGPRICRSAAEAFVHFLPR